MRQRTLAALRADVRSRADMTNSPFITDTEVNEFINESISVLYGKLVGSRGQDYYEKAFPTFNTAQGVQLYSLPTDFWQLIAVEIKDGTFRRVLQPFMRKERARWSEYQVPSGYPIDIFYVPAAARLVADTDNFDGINGWEEWVILDAAIKCLNKEESDVSVLMEQKRQIEREIELLAPERDASWPERVVDVSHPQTSSSPFIFSGGVPRYRLRGATGPDGTGQQIEILWGPAPLWFNW